MSSSTASGGPCRESTPAANSVRGFTISAQNAIMVVMSPNDEERMRLYKQAMPHAWRKAWKNYSAMDAATVLGVVHDVAAAVDQGLLAPQDAGAVLAPLIGGHYRMIEM